MTDTQIRPARRQNISLDPLFRPLYSKIAATKDKPNLKNRRRYGAGYSWLVWYLPMILTLVRLLIVPLTWPLGEALRLHDTGRAWWLVAAVVVLMLTDALDGGVARAIGHVTRAGARLDPIVDKTIEVLLFSQLIWAAEVNQSRLLPAFVVIVTARLLLELPIWALAIAGEFAGANASAGPAGKIKFFVDCLGMLVMAIGQIVVSPVMLVASLWLFGANSGPAAIALKYQIKVSRRRPS